MKSIFQLEDMKKTLKENCQKTGCVIMASGMSVRFGSNKLMADFCGEPMFMRVIHATEGLFDRRIVVTRHREIAELCHINGVEAVLHDFPNRNHTVRLGLEAVGDTDCCMFCPADQPLLRRETVRDLLSLWKNDRNSIVRPVCDGNPGAPVIFPSWMYGELLALPEKKGGSFVIGNHPDFVKNLPVNDPLELMDADTSREFELLIEKSAF